MKKQLVLGLALLCTTLSCKKETSQPDATKYLIFGDFYGFCVGSSCVDIYKLTDAALYEDQKDSYPRRDTFYVGDFKPRSQADFDQVKSLIDRIPTALLQNPNNVIGEPDATDGGGYYIEYKDGSTHRFWVIDKFDFNVPADLQPFLKEVEKQLVYLQN
jgi:hypothetical protein